MEISVLNHYREGINMLKTRKIDSIVSYGKVFMSSLCIILLLSVTAYSSWPEFWLSNGCFSGSAYGTQISPSITSNGTISLVVWEDERINSERDIFGARVSAQGEILDPSGIPICTASNLQTEAKAACGEENFLVVWTDYRNGSYDVYGARIDYSGNVLDPNGFPISAGSWWESSPDVSWDGTNFFVVWADERNYSSASDIFGTRVTPGGEVLDDSGIQISFGPQMEVIPSISCNGSTYLVVWELEGG